MSYNLPCINEIKNNFISCNNWEEKYLYIIELGNQIPILSRKEYSSENFIPGCQSRVWVSMKINSYNYIQFKGDSDSSIVKGLLTIIFIFYNKKTYNEIITFDIKSCFKQLNFNKYLTYSRIQGINIIIRTIKNKLKNLIMNLSK
ncbi:cysteine desulfuration protein SufE [Enterobacteriaceae endosymbiont of Donacia bicoloricornis]|uniref:cysteine desulfuration protein SufE n=1 Tax=Enterobacteriaceae endosymbiont of Donacia bicoloricornis TaxID=2675772 RepID=UPI00144964BA|nr:cysteine desulfuration protein SufE [Enterobacteriaceae endosymbiont of Donacia bicoloricornis]QJC37860.1 cysteine desulfuration protein SufE [Enterobacteriaceae endosymbiont of Donacia bicoloricornis]